MKILLLISGDSTGLSAEGITGRVLLILTEVTALVIWALSILVCAFAFCHEGKRLCVL